MGQGFEEEVAGRPSSRLALPFVFAPFFAMRALPFRAGEPFEGGALTGVGALAAAGRCSFSEIGLP